MRESVCFFELPMTKFGKKAKYGKVLVFHSFFLSPPSPVPQPTHGGGGVLGDEADEDALVDGLDADANLAVAVLAEHHLKKRTGKEEEEEASQKRDEGAAKKKKRTNENANSSAIYAKHLTKKKTNGFLPSRKQNGFKDDSVKKG